MFTQSLQGTWQFSQIGKGDWLPAVVPGSTYADLLAADRIPDPFVGKNENQVQWVADQDWEYTRDFEITDKFLKQEHIDLVCDHLDTLAEISINGNAIASTNNMFRRYRWDIKKHLTIGKNSISIILRSPTAYVAEKQKKRALPAMLYAGIAHIRKVQSHFGWDWGPILPVSGISNTIQLEARCEARVEHLHVRQDHQAGAVNLSISASLQQLSEINDLVLEITLTSPDGKTTQKRLPVGGNKVDSQFNIPDPQLWWCNGLGDQPLYEVEVRLLNGKSELDAQSLKIGLRTIKLRREPDQWGESFTFVINDVPIFAKGANWIPADSINTRFTPERLEHLIASTAAANMNMLRVWGGGYYESEAFYDLCDQYGILVWQDFAFACGAYPLDEAEYLENVKLEVVDNILRLRHRASLALWCGNNEMDVMWPMWKKHKSLTEAYYEFFYKVLPDMVKTEDPDTDYWFSSPTSGTFMKNTNKDAWGDTHLWQVWHGMRPFTWFRTRFTRFCSEFGFEALPNMKTIETFAKPQDYDIVSDVMQHHQRCAEGNEKMLYYMADRFRIPKDFADMVSLTQIVQAEAMRYATEHWRRNRDRCSGALYWQLNDCWPVASWASIDHDGRWKALHYAAKRFNAHVALSLEETKTSVGVYVTNDLREAWQGKVRWSLEGLSGEKYEAEQIEIKCDPVSPMKVAELDFSEVLTSFGKNNFVFIAELWQDEQFVSRQTTFFQPEKKLVLPDPKLSAEVKVNGEELIINITAENFARYVILNIPQADVVFSDNYFDVPAGKTIQISAKCPDGLSEAEIRESLQVRSLADMEPAGSLSSDWWTQTKIRLNPNIIKFQMIMRMMD
ncbi:MAG: glycoside hydrolase family 2 protein [Anaerolineaceae bacterium]|nr:glycoside hydrolase family 2 protein [Anaerolineaceae bacterium]